MTNFQTAIFWLSERKKIRRTCWKEGDYSEINLFNQIVNKNNNPVDFSHLSTLMADDWEIYEHNFRLSDFIKEDGFGFKVIPFHKIKQAVELLREEIKMRSEWDSEEISRLLYRFFGGKLL